MSGRAQSSGAVPFAVALGSNMGARKEHLEAAVRALRALPGVVVQRVSPWIESAPVGGPPGQGPYLNGALTGASALSARALLTHLLAIEAARGRRRLAPERNGPRPLDLDLLVYGDALIGEPDLVVPHPRMGEREFVLAPLAQIAPELTIPPGGESVGALLLALRSRTQRTKLGLGTRA